LDLTAYRPQLKKANEFMQKLGIAYMDWKAENIGFSAEGIPKVFDFNMCGLYNPKTSIFTEITEPKSYFWRNPCIVSRNDQFFFLEARTTPVNTPPTTDPANRKGPAR
jgi:serine/threonine protein kinase